MKLATMKLKRSGVLFPKFFSPVGSPGDAGMFCDECLEGCFNGVPNGIERIDLVLFDRPGVNRLRLEFDCYGSVCCDGRLKTAVWAFNKWLKKHMSKSGVVYMEVHY